MMPDLAKAASAEDFFLILGVPFDQRVLDVHRLHVLDRFRRHLARSPAAEGGSAETMRDCLARAYADVAGADVPAREFAVFRRGGFVPLSALLPEQSP